MAEDTKISWAKHTFNPWMGCTKVSEACDGCYAENLMVNRYHKLEWGPHAERVRTVQSNWNKVRRWNTKAGAMGERWFIFCASLADVFDNQVPKQWRRDLFDLCRDCPNLIFLFLSKRPQNMVAMSLDAGGLPPNCALGATCEHQKSLEINARALALAGARLEANFTFLSMEPLLGPCHLTEIRTKAEYNGNPVYFNALSGRFHSAGTTLLDFGHLKPLGWVITGGETDQGAHMARPTHVSWFRFIKADCEKYGVPFHHKQNGEWIPVHPQEPGDVLVQPWGLHEAGDAPGGYPPPHYVRKVGKERSGRLLDGISHDAFPEAR